MPNMGMNEKASGQQPRSALADALFSTTQQRVLAYLYGQPGRSFFATELIRLTGSGSGAVQRELAKLEQGGLVTVSRIGNQKHYQANPDCPIFHELHGIVVKTFGVAVQPLEPGIRMGDRIKIGDGVTVSRAALRKLAKRYQIRRLALFGSAARGELKPSSDVDLLVEFETGVAPSLGGMVEIQTALSKLFGGRKVDLATPAILKNPYRQRAIEKDLEELYAA
jgi:predicted nucleotidyltransferase